MDEVLRFVVIFAEGVELTIPEEGLEAVNGNARVAEGFYLFDLVLAQLMYYCSFLQEFGGFSMKVLAKILGLKTVALLDLRTHIQRSSRNVQQFRKLVLSGRLTDGFMVLEAQAVGGDLYLTRDGFSIVILVLQTLKQTSPCLHKFLPLHRMLILKPEKVHLRLR